MNETTIIYRIEWKDGAGPYCEYLPGTFCGQRDPAIYELREAVRVAHSGCPEHPVVTYDTYPPEAKTSGNMLCGCISLQQLSTWFKGYRAWMARLGFKLCIYHVPTMYVGFGKKQVEFPIRKATLVAKLSPSVSRIPKYALTPKVRKSKDDSIPF